MDHEKLEGLDFVSRIIEVLELALVAVSSDSVKASVKAVLDEIKAAKRIDMPEEPWKTTVFYVLGTNDDYDLGASQELQNQVSENARKQLANHDNDVDKFLSNYRSHNKAIEREIRETVVRLWKRQEQVRWLEKNKGLSVDDGQGQIKPVRMR